MAYILTTIFLWTVFFLVIPGRDWRNYYPVVLFSALLGTVSDLLGVRLDQWAYYGPVVGGLSLWSDLGIAPAEGALFIRFFPASHPPLVKVGYGLAWSAVNALFEWFFVWVGWIGYDHWNPLRAFLFYILFFGLIFLQERWYNGTNIIVKKSNL